MMVRFRDKGDGSEGEGEFMRCSDVMALEKKIDCGQNQTVACCLM